MCYLFVFRSLTVLLLLFILNPNLPCRSLGAFTYVILWFWRYSDSFMTFTPNEKLSTSAGSPPILSSLARKELRFWPKGPSTYLYALSFQEYVSSVHRSIHVSWQSYWEQCVASGNKLAQLKSFLGPWTSCSQSCRSLVRLHINYTPLTHGHLLSS